MDNYEHYFKQVPINTTYIDVYRVLKMFEVTDPCVQHAVKKLLVSGKRGVKSARKDVQEAIASLQRFIQMDDEDIPF